MAIVYLTEQKMTSDKNRPAGAISGIVVTPEMIDAGVSFLRSSGRSFSGPEEADGPDQALVRELLAVCLSKRRHRVKAIG